MGIQDLSGTKARVTLRNMVFDVGCKSACCFTHSCTASVGHRRHALSFPEQREIDLFAPAVSWTAMLCIVVLPLGSVQECWVSSGFCELRHFGCICWEPSLAVALFGDMSLLV